MLLSFSYSPSINPRCFYICITVYPGMKHQDPTYCAFLRSFSTPTLQPSPFLGKNCLRFHPSASSKLSQSNYGKIKYALKIRPKMALYSEDVVPPEKRAPRRNRILKRKGWANPQGLTLRQVTPEIWVIERSYMFFGIDVGGRSTLIKLSNGSFFVHAPLSLTQDLYEEIQVVIGGDKTNISVIAIPNFEHCDFVNEWKAGYPQAKIYGAPGLKDKKPNLAIDEDFSRRDLCPDIYSEDIDQVFISCAPYFNEVVFFHKPSQTLLCTDLFWNYPKNTPSLEESLRVGRLTQFWDFAMNRIYLPVYKRVLVNDRKIFRTCLDKIFGWKFQNIIPCHGDIVEKNGEPILKEFLGFEE